jgi:hypothetical protein
VRRTLAGAGLAVLAAVLGACDTNTEPAVPRPSITLSATFDATPDSLTIDYRVVNADEVPVVVFTGVPVTETVARPEVDPNAVYVTAAGDDVELSKRLFSVPAGVDPAAYFTIRGVVLAPGAAFTEQVVVPLPLQPRRPYGGAIDPPLALPADVRTVRFCVGAAREDQVFAVPADTVDPDPAPVYPHGHDADKVQTLACSDPYSLPS